MAISKDTIIRTIILVFALINQALTSSGCNPLPFSDELIYELATVVVTIGASVWAWWKNNSITKEAIEADKYLAELKAQKKNEGE